MKEIERKFRVLSDTYKTEAVRHTHIVQGFLNTHPERTVRVRVQDDRAFLTVKGKSNAAGTTRLEWETAIDPKEAKVLLSLCEPGVIEKIRYEVPVGKHTFEVDMFLGNNQGLTVAEIELQHEDETFPKPDWLGPEVTGDVRYYNTQLSRNPFEDWD